MEQKATVYILTGSIGAGKTLFLSNIVPSLKSKWTVDGFVCLTEDQNRKAGENSSFYKLKFIDNSNLFSWAKRRESKRGYIFNSHTKELVSNKLSSSNKEIIVLDDLGPSELKGEGFAQLFKILLNKDNLTLIVVVKKKCVDQFLTHFNISKAITYDIDTSCPALVEKKLLKNIHRQDSEKLTLFATIGGLTEVTIGSFLRAIHLPFKGHLLSLIQCFLLIQFTKELKGRGLILIALISASLKSFSPTGSKLKPMLYIFIQGALFSLPIQLMGANLISITIGALLLGIITIYLSLFLNTLIYGMAYLDSMENIFRTSLSYFDFTNISFWNLVFLGAVIKALFVIIVVLLSYYFDFSKTIESIKAKISAKTADTNYTEKQAIRSYNWKESFKGGLRDISLKRFIIPFIFTSLLIYFFTHLTFKQFSFVLIRAFLLSWFGFVIGRRINFNSIVNLLNRKGLDHWADGLERSISTIQTFRDKKK